jgi:hypothetical protein
MMLFTGLVLAICANVAIDMGYDFPPNSFDTMLGRMIGITLAMLAGAAVSGGVSM